MNKSAMVTDLIKHYGDDNQAKLARILGITPQAINSWRVRNTFDAELIYAKCEGISAHWLLTGEGEMLDGSVPTSEDALTRHLLDTIREQAEEIGRLKEQLEKKGRNALDVSAENSAHAG